MRLYEKVVDLIDSYEEELIELRREFHRYPELSHKEFRTSELVRDYLLGLGFEVRAAGPTGLIADFVNGPGSCLLLRSELDGLPIDERFESDYKSLNQGVMHACGHDVHIANLLMVARLMVELKSSWQGRLRLAFQPAEERGGGAKEMIEAGLLEEPVVDLALALHVMGLKKGLILLKSGSILASSDGFLIEVLGKNAHSRVPQKGIDAINIASHIVVALNSILSKEIDPLAGASFSIGTIEGGSASNIIADRVVLKGILRSLDDQARESIRLNLEKISTGLASSLGGSCKFSFHPGYPSVINDEEMTAGIRRLFIEEAELLYRDLEGGSHLITSTGLPLLSADDFGFISRELPSVYFIVGTGDRAPNHSSEFFVEEAYIKLCTRTMGLAALDYLKKK